MNIPQKRIDFVHPIGLAVAMTVIAEAIYFLIWGLLLFPNGSIIGKFWWTLTCGVAMGSVIGSAMVIIVVGRMQGNVALNISALAFFAATAACAFLCVSLDVRLNYFGGVEHAQLFVLSGVIPAAFGSVVYGPGTFGSRCHPLAISQSALRRTSSDDKIKKTLSQCRVTKLQRLEKLIALTRMDNAIVRFS